MKRRIIALLMATLSATTMFASCNKDEGGAINCKAHVDANKDTICDSCKRAIVTVVEKIEPEKEERVDMVVNPIPTEAKRSDYIVETLSTATKLGTKLDKQVADELDSEWAGTWYTSLEEKEVTPAVMEGDIVVTPAVKQKVWKLYDTNKKEIYSFTSDRFDNGNNNKNYWETYAGTYENIFTREKTVTTVNDEYGSSYEQTTWTYRVFSKAGEQLFTYSEDYEYSRDAFESFRGDSYGNYVYYTFNGKTQILDRETFKIVKTVDSDWLIKRPEFTEVVGNYGYVVSDSEVWVYNLASQDWIDCVYYAEAPAAWNGVKVYVMQDGKILMQGTKILSSSAASYDYIVGETKFDIVQTITDVATKETKEVEFGYLINDFEVATAEDGYTDKAKNIVSITTIENDALANTLNDVVIDNELNILYVYEASLIAQDDSEKRLVAPNLYLTKLVYDYASWTNVLVDGDGKLVAYVPSGYEDCGNYMRKGNAFYAWTDLKNAKFTLAENQEFVQEKEEYSIIRETNEVPDTSEGAAEGATKTEYKYYIFNKFTLTTKEFAFEYNKSEFRAVNNEYFVVYNTEEVPDTESEVEGATKRVYKYDVYTAEGKAFSQTFETYAMNWAFDNETGKLTVTLYNGDVYVG